VNPLPVGCLWRKHVTFESALEVERAGSALQLAPLSTGFVCIDAISNRKSISKNDINPPLDADYPTFHRLSISRIQIILSGDYLCEIAGQN
jgi:hypothetical protein